MGLSPIFPFRNFFSIPKVNLRANNEIFVNNDNLEDDINVNGNTPNSDDSGENGNSSSSHKLFTPTLEDLKKILYVALNPYFEEFEIEVVSCPCLTRAPYNLAAAGLSGNTGTLELGTFDNLFPSPRTDFVFDIQDILSKCNDDVFVIGSGFAAQPLMPYNGHLTINAIVSANPTNVINNSCIAYEDTPTGLTRMEIINDHNQIKCSLFGHFFFSGGKRGPVIKMRAKGRKSRSNIIALIQAVLTKRCQYQPLIGLGIVLVLNGGQTIQFLLLNNYVSHDYHDGLPEYYDRLCVYSLNCKNLIAMGALVCDQLMAFKNDVNRMNLLYSRGMFNTFFNDESFGNFFNDDAPEKTEYIAYINIAQERCFAM